MHWCLLVVVFCQAASRPGGAKCLTDPTDGQSKSYSTYKGYPLVLTIESSDSITHNVTSNIYAIFLKEVLGYSERDVRIVIRGGHDASAALERLSEIEGKDDEIKPPESLINLEVWAEPYFPISRDRMVQEVGPINPPGRFGWFLRDKPGVTWQTFQSADSSRLFALPAKDLTLILGKAVDVKHSGCVNGTYTPDRCSLTACATLLAANFESTREVIHQIDALELYVQVVWLGSHLLDVLNSLPSGAPRLVITWSPGEVTIRGTWHPVTLPSCLDAINPSCIYDTRRIIKLVSSRVKVGAPPAFMVASDIEFTQQEYLNFLQQGIENPETSHYTLACEWMRENKKRWKPWQPPGQSKPVLTICGIFPFTGGLFSAEGLHEAAIMAVENVNTNKAILPEHDLDLAVHNGQCNSDRVTNTFIDYILEHESKRMVGILGPACSETVEPLVGITKYFRTVVISYSAEGSIFSNREQYPYFFRTIGENQQYKQVYLKLMERLGWKRIAALTEDGQKYTEYLSHLQDLLQARNLTFITHRKFPRDRANATMTTYLEDLLYRRARIIVADVHDVAARSVMCAALHLKMTAAHGFVWFLPEWLSHSWYDTDSNRTRSFHENVDCTTAQMREAIQGHFSLAHQYYAPNDTVTHENITVQVWKDKYRLNLQAGNKRRGESDYAGFAYDAVWTYALALHKLYLANETFLADIHSPDATKKYVELIQHTDFMGVSGRIQFLSGASRTTNINIMQWLDGSFHVVGSVNPIVSQRKVQDFRLFLNVSKIRWLTVDGQQPTDGEEPSSCIFQGLADLLNLDCSGAIIVVNIMGFGLLAVILVIAVLLTKYRYDKRVEQLELTEKFMKVRGFDLLPNLSELDKWEISRDCVVINRRLGEGAFGTVYGGEAYFEKEGWVAAAVKTLKVNSTTEQKLDFLSEAEVMKRFDHKNIVKLLGVCTRHEPVYTVMEFMLYGDLKTFLLNRRHLVTSRRLPDESNEVSNKKLTSMALDIARGLSYLASLKYIHRDIACRNCLLNSSRVAKIGDFGLTRRMFESDYYKFSRKGMLPIRWMAPESLADGIFTTKSDVWSFGVVLFEIVTFGSYPFQGLSNNEVVEHVKAGNTIPIPKQIKPQLECLIKSCWNLDYRKRPEVSEIVVFLANNPRLLSPCIDTPVNSVAVEEALESRPSVPASPFDPAFSFFPGEDVGDQGTPSASPTECAFPDSASELLIPASKPIHIPMKQMAPLASRTPSDVELQGAVL